MSITDALLWVMLNISHFPCSDISSIQEHLVDYGEPDQIYSDPNYPVYELIWDADGVRTKQVLHIRDEARSDMYSICSVRFVGLFGTY